MNRREVAGKEITQCLGDGIRRTYLILLKMEDQDKTPKKLNEDEIGKVPKKSSN